MSILEVIKSRRTVHKYKPNPVPEKIKEQILEAATWAPSHHNEQPWEFWIIGPDTRKRLLGLYKEVVPALLNDPDVSAKMKEAINTLMDDFGGAPLMIAVLTKKEEEELHDLENSLAGGVAVQNMMLTAQDNGLGSAWLTFGSIPPVHGKLQVPEDKRIISLLIFGYAETVPDAPTRTYYKEKLKELD